MSASDVHETLVSQGLKSVTINAVRNHLNRLVTDGKLDKDEDGYTVATPMFVPAEFKASAADDDIPF